MSDREHGNFVLQNNMQNMFVFYIVRQRRLTLRKSLFSRYLVYDFKTKRHHSRALKKRSPHIYVQKFSGWSQHKPHRRCDLKFDFIKCLYTKYNSKHLSTMWTPHLSMDKLSQYIHKKPCLWSLLFSTISLSLSHILYPPTFILVVADGTHESNTNSYSPKGFSVPSLIQQQPAPHDPLWHR